MLDKNVLIFLKGFIIRSEWEYNMFETDSQLSWECETYIFSIINAYS